MEGTRRWQKRAIGGATAKGARGCGTMLCWASLGRTVLFAILLGCTSPAGTPLHLARLSHTEWDETTVSLLGLRASSGLADTFVADPASATFDNDAAQLWVSPTLWQQYQAAAETLAERVVDEASLYEHVVPKEYWEGGEWLLPRDPWIASFGRRVYRRELSPEEVASYAPTFDLGASLYATTDPFRDGVRATVAAMLQSPYFLHRVEAAADPEGTELDGYSMASKLSFALWNSMPDETLLGEAETVGAPAELLAEVPRMLGDVRARRVIADLHRQLLHVDSYANIPREFVSYEEYDLTENAVMQAEVQTFIDQIVFGGGTVADLLTSRRTYVDAQVADVYGVSGVEGIGTSEMVAVDLNPAERSGVLTLSGFLAYHANSTEENLITRGAFVHTALMCTILPPPPDTATALPPPAEGQTLRARIDSHTSECGGGCHTQVLNPIGFAFGNYDEKGRYQIWEDAADPAIDPPIDASGTYTFSSGAGTFVGAPELSALLAVDERVHRCYAKRLLSYLEGRSVTADDDERIETLAARSLAGAPILGLVEDIVGDEAFRTVSP